MLFSGDVPLPITFWVFGMLIGVLFFNGLGIVISETLLQPIALPYSRLLATAFVLLGLTYLVISWIAIWRSSIKFEGSQVWAKAARAMVIFWVLTSFLVLIR